MPFIEYPECGKIINTHGCHGGVKIEPWCDSPGVLAALPSVYLAENGGMSRLAVKKASVYRDVVFAQLEGVDTVEAAERLRGKILHARREDLHLPQGVLLVAELTGLPVVDKESGTQLGRIRDVIHPANTDIYVIDTPNGEVMVPAVPAFVQAVDAEKGVFLTPIEGMFS